MQQKYFKHISVRCATADMYTVRRINWNSKEQKVRGTWRLLDNSCSLTGNKTTINHPDTCTEWGQPNWSLLPKKTESVLFSFLLHVVWRVLKQKNKKIIRAWRRKLKLLLVLTDQLWTLVAVCVFCRSLYGNCWSILNASWCWVKIKKKWK